MQVLFVDVGNVQELNERIGHHAGDAALQAVARALAVTFRKRDVLARIGGTQFLALVDPPRRARLRRRHQSHPDAPRRARDHGVRRRRPRGVLRLDDAPGRRPLVARGADGPLGLGHARGEGGPPGRFGALRRRRRLSPLSRRLLVRAPREELPQR